MLIFVLGVLCKPILGLSGDKINFAYIGYAAQGNGLAQYLFYFRL